MKSQCAQYIPHAFLYQSTGGSITINNKGVWFCQGGSQIVSVCHGNIVGQYHNYNDVQIYIVMALKMIHSIP